MRALFIALLLALYASVHAKLEFSKIFVIIFENTEYEDAAAVPYFANLRSQGLTLTQYYGVARPSQPNYVAIIGGDTFGIEDDGVYNLTASPTLVDLLEGADKTWKVYAEGYPSDLEEGVCFTDARQDNYVRKHNPFISFNNIRESPERCNKIQNAQKLDPDLDTGLPNFSFYVPDMRNDGHDTSVSDAGEYLQGFFEERLSKLLQANTLVIVTFDEGRQDNSSSNHMLTILLGNGIPADEVDNATYNHYDLLKSIQYNFGLGNLGRNDATATPFTVLTTTVQTTTTTTTTATTATSSTTATTGKATTTTTTTTTTGKSTTTTTTDDEGSDDEEYDSSTSTRPDTDGWTIAVIVLLSVAFGAYVTKDILIAMRNKGMI